MILSVSNWRRPRRKRIRTRLTGPKSGLETIELVRSVKQSVAASLCALMAVGVPLTSASPEMTGVLNGRARAGAKRLSDYAVQLRDAQTGRVLTIVSIDEEGLFVAKDVPVSKPYLLELIRTTATDHPVLCTAGPYTVAPDPKVKTNARLDCGRAPAAFWVLAAAAGTAGFTSFVTRSASQ